MFSGKTLRLIPLNDGLVELCFDRQGEAVNKFDRLTLAELKEAVGQIAADKSVRGVLLSSAKDVFIVGADIFEFTEMFALDEAALTALAATNSAIFTAFDDLPVPTVAAINGFALGGGLEMALAADYRVMSKAAQIGVPEVTLGIVPGYGGTVRLARLGGVAVALDWVTSGSQRKAEAALEAKAVDAVASPEELRATALDWLGRAVAGALDWKTRRTQRHGSCTADPAAVEKYRAESLPKARNFPAALGAVELIQRASGLNRDEALKLEAAAFAKLAKTPTAASLVGIFLDDQSLKKKNKQRAKNAHPVRRAAVLGAGIMGGGIAYTTAVRGMPTIMKDIAEKALELGMTEAQKLLTRQVTSGRMAQAKADALLASIKPSLDYTGFNEIDAVVEAVVENMDIKKKVLAEVEAQIPEHALIATNTSSLVVGDIAQALKRPQNFVGMHFFNPVPVMPLVEVIRGPQTSDAATAMAVGYALAMGKTPVVVKDCPGFLVNRMLTAYYLGHLHLLRDGADFEKVDRVMEAFGWPMGPAYLQDVMGMDTTDHVFDMITAGYPDRMKREERDVLSVMAENKRFGQKTGLGFYRYEKDAKGKPKRMPADDTRALLAQVQPKGTRDFSEREIEERMMLPMIVDAAHCLESGVSETPEEIDVSVILAIGFPRHLGGILRYADMLGMRHVVERCEHYAQELGPCYAPTERMREMARKGEKYFAA